MATAEVNGIQMNYLEAGSGDDVLVLLHGGTESAVANWAPMIPLFADRFRVIAPDSRGHGGTVNDGTLLSYPLMADDVAGLCTSLGVHRAVFCGFSDGANIALELALREPELVRAAVLHGCAVGTSPVYERAICWFFHIASIDAPADLDAMEAGMPELVAAMERWHAAQGSGHWRNLVRMVEPLFKHPPAPADAELAAVQVPVLVLEGDRDEFLPLEGQLALHRRLPGSELAVMPRVGHGFPQQPRRYVELVGDFLDRAGPG